VLELWQAEWCPYSHRVRLRLTAIAPASSARGSRTVTTVPVSALDSTVMSPPWAAAI